MAAVNGDVARHAVFRASAGADMGAGHIMRCMALAEILRRRGWRCVFAAAPESRFVVPALASFEAVEIDDGAPEDEQAAKVGAALGAVDLCVVDHYDLSYPFENAARSWARSVAVIDDVPKRRHDADLLLDPSGGRNSDDYLTQRLVPVTCRVLAGPAFALLRAGFAERERPAAPSTIERVFVSMGATDPDNLTAAALPGIRAALPVAEIDVMLSASAPHVQAVRDDAGPGVAVHTDVDDVAVLMANADIAVGTAGINLWERCAMRIPSLLVIAAENQRDNARFAQAEGAARIIAEEGTPLLPSRVTACLDVLVRAPEDLWRMCEAARAVCDGHGAERTADAIERIM